MTVDEGARLVLRGAANLLRNSNLCKGSYAKTSDGRDVNPFHNSAAQFCAIGAMQRAMIDQKLEWIHLNVAKSKLTDMLTKTHARFTPITEWSDMQDSKEPVIEGLQNAAVS